MHRIKKEIGCILRGLRGIYENNFENFPKISPGVNWSILGYSVDGGEIGSCKIGNGSQKIIFISAIHGNEVGTVKLAHQLINWLGTENRGFKEKFTIFVIPCLNPDGYKCAKNNPDYFNGGKVGRFNANNVDLNRNFPTSNFQSESIWSFGKNYTEKERVFCGKFGGSESEIKTLIDFIITNHIKIAFFFHNAGRDVMGNKLPLSQTLIRIYGEETGFRVVENKEWQKMGQTGTAKEWCEINGIAYIEVEGSTRWGSDWNIQKPAITKILEEIKTINI